ncbi:MAG TPA: NAD-binding protein, partial [Anaerolineae bacterium]
LLTASVGERLRRRRMLNVVDKLTNHVIVCGYGRVGQSAVTALNESARPIVLIEKDEPEIQQALETGLTVIEGDATNDEVLLQAGIERAWGLIVCTGDDSVNLFIVLSARALNPKLFIIARSDADNEAKMRRAGADRVVSPYQIGGKHMANIAIRPHVADFLDVVTLNGGIELWLEELVIGEDSQLVGQTVGEANIRQRTGVTMVAMLRHSNGGTIMPDANTRMEVGDELIVLGTREQLAALEDLTGSRMGH